MAWTEESRAKAVELYLAGEPTAENSIELCKSIAEELEESVNGVRQVLTQEKVYIKKEPVTAATKAVGKDGEPATKRVSKEDQIAELRKAILDKGAEVEDEILTKLTGKAAAYFVKVLAA